MTDPTPVVRLRTVGTILPVLGAGLLLLGLLILPVACSGGNGGGGGQVGFLPGNTIARMLMQIPRGSRADVRAKGAFDPATGSWTVELCRLMDTGHEDDAVFTPGQNLVFSMAATDNSGGIHNGAPTLTLAWSGAPSSNTVVVNDLDDLDLVAPVIDGDASDEAWTDSFVVSSTVGFSPQSGDNGILSMIVQAGYLDGFIYFRATWTDPGATESRSWKQWVFDGTTWTRPSGFSEDRLYFMFDIAGALGTSTPGFSGGTTTPFGAAGCGIACHGDGKMRLDAGRADIWHWKAGRSDPVGYADDKHLVAAASGVNGRKGDEGKAASRENILGAEPEFQAASDPGANAPFLFEFPAESERARALVSNTGFANGDTVPGYVTTPSTDSRGDVNAQAGYQGSSWNLEIARRLDSGRTFQYGGPIRFRSGDAWSAGDTIPGYVGVPPLGSAGDVSARGAWVSGTWTVEYARAVDTGNPDDVVFDPTGGPIPFSVAITDNSGGTHNGNPTMTLDWSGTATATNVVSMSLGGNPSPIIDGDGNDLAWGLAPQSTVTLTPQSGSNGITSVQIQSVRTLGTIYWKLVWSDSTRNDARKRWTFDGTTWQRGALPSESNEDRAFLMFDIGGATGNGSTFASSGCAIACHGTPGPGANSPFYVESGACDMWHWKASRTNPSGFLDDKQTTTLGRLGDDGVNSILSNESPDGSQPAYQAFDDPGSSAGELNFALRMFPEDAPFLVGRSTTFSLGLTDNAGSIHDGAPVLNLAWGGMADATTIVPLDLVAGGIPAPAVDGGEGDAAWIAAQTSTVALTPMSGGGAGITQALVQAAFDRDKIYFRVKWTDPSATRTIGKKRRVFDGAAWSTTGATDEDRAFLWWPITEALGTATPGTATGTTTPFRTQGCGVACHGDGVMRLDAGRLESWHWKAARGNVLGFLDDKFVTQTPTPISGRFSDVGSGATSDNGTPTAPAFQAADDPGANRAFLLGGLLADLEPAVSILPPGTNVAPVASAGADQNVTIGASVTLDGSGSFDPEGQPLTYQWTQTGGTTVTLAGGTTVMPTFTAPAAPGTLTFQLIVSDGLLDSPPDTVDVVVSSAPAAISYGTQVHPIWMSRGCTNCHTGGSPAGGLLLDDVPSVVYPNVLARSNLADPPNSLILMKPLAQSAGGVGHGGGGIFQSTSDPDYVTILTWIQEGAQNN